MIYVIAIVRILLGLAFTVVGLDHFLHFLKMDQPPLTAEATHFMAALHPTGYLTVVKVLELTGGILLLSGLCAPLGLVLLMPVIVNIALWEIFLMKKPEVGVVFLVMAIFLIWAYRAYFASVFTCNARSCASRG